MAEILFQDFRPELTDFLRRTLSLVLIFQKGNINLRAYLSKLSYSYRQSTIQCYKNISKKFCNYLNTVLRGDFPNLVIDTDLHEQLFE